MDAFKLHDLLLQCLIGLHGTNQVAFWLSSPGQMPNLKAFMGNNLCHTGMNTKNVFYFHAYERER